MYYFFVLQCNCIKPSQIVLHTWEICYTIPCPMWCPQRLQTLCKQWIKLFGTLVSISVKMASISDLMAVFCFRTVCRYFLKHPTHHSRHLDYPPVALRSPLQKGNVSLFHLPTIDDCCILCIDNKSSRQIIQALLVETRSDMLNVAHFFLDFLLLSPILHRGLLPTNTSSVFMFLPHSTHTSYFI